MLLKRLTEANGVSGNEKEVRDIIIEEIKDYVDELEVDKIGNIIVHKKGNKKKTRVMLAAHMDEVGLMVTKIDDSGLIKFSNVGGIDKRLLVSKRVKVGKNKITGVIGAKPIHLQKPDERKKALDIKKLYVDIGTNSREETERIVKIGDYISFESNYTEFGSNLIKAKALDDRVGCDIIINLLKSDLDIDFYAAFTVMEEIGLVGAGPAAYNVDPEIAIIIEGTTCADIPGIEDYLKATELGKGPVISLMDKTTYFDKGLRDLLIETAKKENIPFQFRKTSVGGNDSGKIHLEKEGVRTSTISVPCRYIHSPSSVMNKNDYYNSLKLVESYLKNIFEGGLK